MRLIAGNQFSIFLFSGIVEVESCDEGQTVSDEIDQLLDELLALPAETEWLEFKEAKFGFSQEDLGRYFSALSNEANLKSKPCGWLVFGVANKPPRKVVGSQFKPSLAAAWQRGEQSSSLSRCGSAHMDSGRRQG